MAHWKKKQEIREEGVASSQLILYLCTAVCPITSIQYPVRQKQ